MEVTEGGLMLIWCFVQMARVQMPDGKWVRRVTRIDEVIPGKELTLAKVFRWDPRRDEFTPDAPQKVVAASRRLRDAAESRGWTVKELVEDLRRRNEFLERLVKERKLSYGEFLKEIDGWYHG
jgi:hypothetical protein